MVGISNPLKELRILRKESDFHASVANLWIFTTLLYLLRTIFPPLKYLFVVSFGILLICYLFILLKKKNKWEFVEVLRHTKEFHLVGLFLVLGILLSSQVQILSIKSLVNYLGISFFLLVFYEIRNQIDYFRLLKGWLLLSFIIGCIGILKWINLILNLRIGLFSNFYISGTSLVPEYNFYAFYFIVSVLISFYFLSRNKSFNRIIFNQFGLFVYILNLAFSGSRRGLIIMFAMFIYGLVYLIITDRQKRILIHKNLISIYAIISGLILITLVLIPFRYSLIRSTNSQKTITRTIYRYSTLFVPKLTYQELKSKLWSRSAIYENDSRDWSIFEPTNIDTKTDNPDDLLAKYWIPYQSEGSSDNLLYNGDFKHGSKFWINGAPEDVSHDIIQTRYGSTLRISRRTGAGRWPLKYEGRQIYYYRGSEYAFRFKFRVIKGDGIPFMIGWGINEGDGPKSNLPKTLKRLEDGWFECIVSYRFQNDQTGINAFMNSQEANTVIDFADIVLSVSDENNHKHFVDQFEPSSRKNLLYNGSFEHGLKFWNSSTEDRISQKKISTEFGKAIRVKREDGSGGWPLIYRGREIFYHRGLVYTFRFKCRPVQGSINDFKIGWGWHDRDNETQVRAILRNNYPVNDEWFECVGSYTFKQDHSESFFTFLFDQKDHTIFDFTDIELFCNDSLNSYMFIDENINSLKEDEEFNQGMTDAVDEARLLQKRKVRWQYAYELWTSEYNWTRKIFGGGFDYLGKFGKKFYPDEDRIDYPHNPFISAFLYSGLLGGIIYMYFVILSFWFYFKYRNYHQLVVLLFLICFFFVFISSDSHFNVPIFAILSLVPFVSKFLITQKKLKKE